jgi:lipoprotein-releasing system permease protein
MRRKTPNKFGGLNIQMLKLFLWLRYLRKKKIVILSISAVALSTALLTVVASLFIGFINTLEQTAVQTIGDIVLSAPVTFAQYPLFIEQLEKTSTVQAATAILSSQGLLHLGKGNVRAVYIWGIEPARRTKVTGFKKFLRRQGQSDKEPSFEDIGKPNQAMADSPNVIGAFVGIAVIAEPNETTDEYDYNAIDRMIGEQVILTTGAEIEAEDMSSNSQASNKFKRRTLKLTIADIVQTGVYDLDKGFVYLPIEQLQEILYPAEKEPLANQIQIKLADGVQPDVAIAQIRGVWRNFVIQQLNANPFLIRHTAIETAKQMQSQYAGELRKQMGVLLLIFGVVSFSVVVLVFCIFYMIARLKQRDIAIVKSCGAASSSVALVFLGFGCCVGTIGSGLGVILAYIEGWIRIIFGLKLWKSSVYMFSKIPNNVDWWAVLPIVLFAIIAAIIGTVIPAIIAASTKPVEILRYE